MSASDIDIKKLGRIIFIGAIVSGIASVGLWSLGDMAYQHAIKGGVGIGIGWILGNLADCGLVLPNMEGLRK